MHQDVGDSRIALLDRALYLVSNMVAFPHGNVPIDSVMKIDVKLEAHFP